MKMQIRNIIVAALLALFLPITAQAALVVPNGGEVIMLGAITSKVAPETLVLQLYESDTTPGETDTSVTYTEATAPGYAEEALTPASWTITSGAPSDAEFPQVTFTFTGAGNAIYGYIVVETTSGDLVWAERFTNGPYTPAQNGDQIKVTPRITMD